MSNYVILEDIHILLQDWARKKNFSLPPELFFEKLQQEMRGFLEYYFGKGNVDIVPAEELRHGLKSLVDKFGVQPVSMDKVYFLSSLRLETNRILDESLEKKGISSRFGFEPIQLQVERLCQQCPKNIVLVDDVVCSGIGMVKMIDLFRSLDIEIKMVIVGIAVGKGVQNLRQKGVDVHSVRFYSDVIGEIYSERDFYPGVPFSGLLVQGKYEIGAPFLLPFGKPDKWASIPQEKTKDFSIFCLNQTIKLWQKIEEVSGRPVLVNNLQRIPYGISDMTVPIKEALKEAKNNLLKR